MKSRWNNLLFALLLTPALAPSQNLARTPDGRPNVEGYWDPQIGGTFSL
jgi:hypothetical protein